MPSGSRPVEIFVSYSHRDEEFRAQLETHLALLKRSGAIETWHDRRIGAGQEWSNQISEHLESANLILLLISADFLASDYCYDIEMTRALQRHAAGEAAVVPIILRTVDGWQSAPFAGLQALPKDGRPITSWPDRDEAWTGVARGIRLAVERLRARQAEPPELVPPPPSLVQERAIDAAIPARAAVGRSTQLVAMVRRLESGGLGAELRKDDGYDAAPDDVRSKSFQIQFPRDALGEPAPAELILRVEAPDFEPASQSKKIDVPPDGDSDVCVFLLTPRYAGVLNVNLEVLTGDVHRASRLLRTHAEQTEQPIPAGAQVLVSIPLLVTGSAPAGEFTRLVLEARAAGRPEVAAPAEPVPYAPQPAAPSPNRFEDARESRPPAETPPAIRQPAHPAPPHLPGVIGRTIAAGVVLAILFFVLRGCGFFR